MVPFQTIPPLKILDLNGFQFQLIKKIQFLQQDLLLGLDKNYHELHMHGNGTAN